MNANTKYHEIRKQIENEIEILKQKLESMDISQKEDTKNYGYVGNVNHILNEISELNYGFLSNN